MAEKSESKSGILWIVSTPIGNLGDISERARSRLAESDFIACEDKRVTAKLLRILEIPSRPLLSYHEHNEQQAAGEIADKVAEGASVALVCDAGTPTLSDPGFRVVRECRSRGLTVFPVPGPVAFVAALSVSGLPSDQIRFVGFLPPKTSARKRFFEENAAAAETLVLYESTHRITKFIDDLVEVLGEDRCVCFARELTKLHETVLTGRAAEVREQLTAGSTKGEFVVLIAKDGFQL